MRASDRWQSPAPRRYGRCVSQDVPEGVSVPIAWLGVEDVPILHVNAMISQYDPQTLDSLLLTIGQLTPPVINAASAEEREEQARAVAFVPIKPVVRLALS